MRKSNSNVLGTLTPTATSEALGNLNFIGVTSGSSFDTGAQIYAVQNGAAGTTVPTDLKFRTWTNSAPNNDQLVLHTDGSVSIGGELSLSSNSITISGSIGVTGTRVTKGWFTDLESTNPIAASITGSAATVSTISGLAPDVQNTYTRTQYLIPVASSTSAFGEIAIGTANQVLTSNGAGAAPTFQNSGAGTGDLLANGSIPLTANWDVGAFKISALQLESDIVTGTPPLIVASTTVVTNLNVDQVDGKDSTDLILVDGTQAMTGELNMGANSIGSTLKTYTGDGTTTIDMTAGKVQYFTHGAMNDAFTITPPTLPGAIILYVKQDGVGGRSFTVTANWAGSVQPAPTSTASAIDVYSVVYDGTTVTMALCIANAG